MTEALATVRVTGSALPADVLSAVVSGADGLGGLDADAYRLELGVSPREAANRAWSVLTGAYDGYRKALADRPEGDPAVGLTREKWLAIVLRELGFGRVPTTRAGGLSADDRQFPISHQWHTEAGHVPIHLLGWGVELDKRTPGQAGAADRAPHAMLQEYLNRTDAALWGVVSNGRRLRLLRDSSTLIGQSFVEFDLEAMFDGEVFSDFVVLYLVCHATRFETRNPDGTYAEDPTPADCWLERWRGYAVETGTRALTALRPAVAQAIATLGSGFTRHPQNDLHRRLAAREITPDDVHHALLRLVYRLLFCFVGEDRELLLDPSAPTEAQERYNRWFSTARLRRVSTRRRGSGHGDHWQSLRLVLGGLGSEGGRPELALPGLGGIFELGESDIVAELELSNAALLEAVRHLTVVQPVGGGPKRRVDYRNLGAEELGSVYESLLEFVPRYDESQRAFSLETVVGNERKTSGAYYTPTSLIDCLLDSALDPLLDDAEKADDPEQALLEMTVCDPACGSGHFLVAAAKRIAARLATVRARAEGAEEPTPLDEQAAMHDVVDRCIYGVDLNPLAAELAKVSLWLESVQPGRALSFLDAHIKVGNALLGATPALLAGGIPDDAFKPLDGDDKKWATSLKKRNREEGKAGQGDLFTADVLTVSNDDIRAGVAAIEQLPTTSLADVHLAARRLREFDQSPELRRARLVADAWCAAFVTVKTPDHPAITEATLRRLADTSGPGDIDGAAAAEADMVRRISDEYKFFHWQLEFPQIFRSTDEVADSAGPGWSGGFSCVLGNPPWDQVELKEQEFFAAFDPEIAGGGTGAARKRLIEGLAQRNPPLHSKYLAAKRRVDGQRHFLGASGRFPLCGRGRINLYAVFAEHGRSCVSPFGRLGVVVPAGIATDATTQRFFDEVVRTHALLSLYHFENESLIFQNVHHAFRFCLLTLAGQAVRIKQARFTFFGRGTSDLDRPGARFEMSPAEIELVNPNSRTCPTFRSRRDAEINLAVYRRCPILRRRERIPGDGWALSLRQGIFNMTSDSHLFRTAADLDGDGGVRTGNRYRVDDSEMLPVYEGKMVHHFDHRWATHDGADVRDVSAIEKNDPNVSAQPRYWVDSREVSGHAGSTTSLDRGWLLCFRDITGTEKVRTMIGTAIPVAGVGHNLPILTVEGQDQAVLVGLLGSLALDYLARQKVGGTHMTFFILEQLPVPTPAAFGGAAPWAPGTVSEFVLSRVLELVYTAWDMQPFAADIGDDGAPFRWDPPRRAAIRAELDAAFFHLYGLDRADTEYVLSTFPIANRNDPELTPRILREYDAMQRAIETGIPYRSPLDPPPGQGPRHDQKESV
jgi:hypothetical protein